MSTIIAGISREIVMLMYQVWGQVFASADMFIQFIFSFSCIPKRINVVCIVNYCIHGRTNADSYSVFI